MEEIILPHLTQHPIHAALYRNVSNADFLRAQLLAGNPAYEYAFLDATMVLSRAHLLAACFRAINDLRHFRLRTRNVHSEVVFALSPNNNIAESFRRFGLSEASRHVIAIKVLPVVQTEEGIGSGHALLTGESVAARLGANIKGQMEIITDAALRELRDLTKLRKVYKFDVKAGLHDDDKETERYIDSVVVGSMALKGY